MVPNVHSSAAKAFPNQARQAVDLAIQETDRRIQDGFDKGRLENDEFQKACRMMDELKDGLTAIGAGEFEVTSANLVENGQLYQLETPSKDSFRVIAREYPTNRGQARIGFRQVTDNGRDLPLDEQVMIRVDQGYQKTEVDLQMGEGPLNFSVHGGIVNKRGRRTRKPNHHFGEHLPETLWKDENFAQFVQTFQKETIAEILGDRVLVPLEKPQVAKFREQSASSPSIFQRLLVGIGLSKGF